MRIINLKSSNEDSFKHSILLSLHYYDISNNLEKINNFQKYEHKYIFKSNNPNEFELNNPSIWLTITDTNNNIIYKSNNNSNDKAIIVKINAYSYASIRPIKNKYIKLKELLKQFTHEELKDLLLNKIIPF